MLSLHAADVVEPGGGRPAVPGGAVLVDGAAIVAVGVFAELAAEWTAARVRVWGGVLRPGREVSELGPGVAADDARGRGEAARRVAHDLLTRGVTSVVGDVPDAAVRAAVARTGLVFGRGSSGPLEAGGRADFAVFAADGSCVATVVAGRVVHRRV